MESEQLKKDFNEWKERMKQSFPIKKKNLQVTKIGRNEACPCNSGKKYKKCCLLYTR
jgi:uncharacterized protein YecA (UPF0149 family)